MNALPRSKVWLAFWWLVWCAVLVQQLALHSWRLGGSGFRDNPAFSRVSLVIILAPFGISMIVRWLAIPRISSPVGAFFLFAGGLGLAGGTALATSFLDVPYKQIVFFICLAGILTFVPLRLRTKDVSA